MRRISALGRDQRDDEHDRVDPDHRRDAVDRRVQVDEQVGQRERDDRRVGQGEAGGDGDQEVANAHEAQSGGVGRDAHLKPAAPADPWRSLRPADLRTIVTLARAVQARTRTRPGAQSA